MSRELLTALFGYSGMVTSIWFLIPQIYKVIRTRRARDISVWMILFMLLNNIVWFMYGELIQSNPLMITNFLSLVLVGALAIVKEIYDDEGDRGDDHPGGPDLPRNKPRLL